MAKIVTSARGERVDFDLIGIKNSMAALPANENVKKRERFINKKRRRGLKRKVDELAQTKRLEDANFDAATELEGADENEQIISGVSEDATQSEVKRRKVK